MKASQIVIGGRYTAKVSGRVTCVRVLTIREKYNHGRYGRPGRWTKEYDVVNERTRRKIVVRSCQRFRELVSIPTHYVGVPASLHPGG